MGSDLAEDRVKVEMEFGDNIKRQVPVEEEVNHFLLHGVFLVILQYEHLRRKD
jgi:hypothetical protein